MGQGFALHRFQKRLGDAEGVVHQDPVGTWPVRQLGREFAVGHPPALTGRRGEDDVQATDEFVRRELGRFVDVETQEGRDIADGLREHEPLAAGHDGHGSRAEPVQRGQAVGVVQYVDRLEPDPTDREELLDPKTARSGGLPVDPDLCVHRVLASPGSS